jgi:large subunit ribosomal protein L17
MLANMASSLITHKRITTTVAKAKALRSYVEPLITKAKEDSTSSRRLVFSYLQDKAAVTELFREISQKVAGRPGGYTRILKTGYRLGDNADMCIIELVDYNEALLGAKEATMKKATRRRRSSKKADVAAAPVAETETPKETPKAKSKDKAPVVAAPVTDEAVEAVTEPVEEQVIAEAEIEAADQVEEITPEESENTDEDSEKKA